MTDYSRSNTLLPHFEEAEAFLNALDGKDAQFTFQTFDDVKGRQDKTLAHIYHGTFNEHKQTLAAINKRGGGVFVTINETDLKGRKKENILKVKAVFVDLDGSPIQPILDLPEDLQPHIIIESSPNKWHAYWLVDNCSLEQFPHVQRALAVKFDGDISVNNIDRVMRLAGFSHNKGESFITRIHTMQDNLYPYSVNKLIGGLGLELEKKKPATARPATDEDDFLPTDETIADIKSALDYLPCEDYQEWTDIGQALKTLGNAGLDLWLTWSSKSEKYDKQKAVDKWHEVKGDRTSYKAIFTKAQEHGWINPLANQWQEPDPIIEPQEATDYPIDELPEPLRLLVQEIVYYLQCPVAMAANSVLAALSLSTQGLVNVSRDNSLIGAVSLFLMVIAESGERKSACDNLVLKAIKKLNDEHFCHDKEQNNDYLTELNIWNSQNNGLHASLTQASKNGEPTDDLKEKIKIHATIKPIQPKGTTFLYEDATIEALTKGLYLNSPSGGIFSSEAGVVFGGHGMNKDNSTRNMATLNKLWDDDSIIVDRSDVSKNMLLTGRRLTLCLATQESTVRAFFDGTNGLARGN